MSGGCTSAPEDVIMEAGGDELLLKVFSSTMRPPSSSCCVMAYSTGGIVRRLPEDVLVEAGAEGDGQLVAEVAEVQRGQRGAQSRGRLRQHAAEAGHKVRLVPHLHMQVPMLTADHYRHRTTYQPYIGCASTRLKLVTKSDRSSTSVCMPLQ